MVYPPPKRQPPKFPALSDSEMAALRDVSNHRTVAAEMLLRLKKLGLIEQKSGVWTTTQDGHIRLMFGSAK
jgi:hypothetical protein